MVGNIRAVHLCTFPGKRSRHQQQWAEKKICSSAVVSQPPPAIRLPAQQVHLKCYCCCSPLFSLPPGKNNDYYIRTLFVDYSSTFNTVIPHNLTDKLSTLGLHPIICDWLLNFDLAGLSLSGLVIGLWPALSQTLALHCYVSSAPSSTPSSPVTMAVARQSTKPPICHLAARSVVLDRGWQIGGLFWSVNFPPRRVHLFPPRLLSKNKASMCRPLHEVGGGVDDCEKLHRLPVNGKDRRRKGEYHIA